jgi:alpha-mannosidase
MDENNNQEQTSQVIFFPHFHYDIVWKFNRKDYSYINLRLFRQVVTLCSIFPEFRFGAEDIYQLEEIEYLDPDLFKKTKEEIARGRIEIIDGQYLMADTFLPGGEVLVSEILRGKRYAREKLGSDVKVGWITDSFGLNAQIPQIYKDAGYEWLAFGRGFDRALGKSEFWWQGLDGTRILSHYFASDHSYHVGLFAEFLTENVKELKEYAAGKNALMPCGFGSSPFPEWILKAIDDFNAKTSDYKIRIASPQEFFKALEKEADQLKVEKGEMYQGDRVFDGVWSTRMWIKLEYFKVKTLILNTEKFSTMAWLLGGHYPQAELKEAWDRILFLAFHDVITGTSIDEVYEEVREDFESLKSILTKLLTISLNHLVPQIGFDGRALVLFNTNSFETRSYAEIEIEFPREERLKGFAIDNAEWELIEEDRDDIGGWLRRAKVGIVAQVLPLGYKIYRVAPGPATTLVSKRRVHGRSFVENGYLKLEVNPLNGIYRIVDVEGTEVVREIRLELENEVGSVYSHKDLSKDFIGLIGAEGDTSPNKPIFVVTDFKVEEGEVCKKISLTEEVYGCFWPYRLREHSGIEFHRQKLMTIVKEACLYEGIPWVEFKVKLTSTFPHIRVRAKFDTGIPDGGCVAGTAFGVIERKTESREFPMEDWVDYSNEKHGVAVFARGIPGYQVTGEDIYLTLLRSVNLISHGDKGPITPVPDALELERRYEYSFAIYPHGGSWMDGKVWNEALNFVNPPLHVYAEDQHSEKKVPTDMASFLSIPENVVISRLKQSEDGTNAILRCYETCGKPTKMSLNFMKKPEAILATNIMEENEEPVGDIIELRPFQIATFKLKFLSDYQGFSKDD